jgi:transcriptional regulator with XRE-family HTH domain
MDLVRISKMIRELRQRQNMTVDQLAMKSGFSKGFISRLENFRVTPSLNALNRISEALGVEIGDIFKSETSSPEYVFGNIESGEEVIRDNSDKYGLTYCSLAYRKLDRVMEPFVIEYHHTEVERDLLMHDTDEFFLLLDGEVEFCVMHESNSRSMKSGDTVYLSKNIPHAVRLPENIKYARALVVYGSSLRKREEVKSEQ